jgi:lipoate-protein ligase A
MICIVNESTNPYFNLALEEYVMTHMPEDRQYFMLWQNEPSIIVGTGQNTAEEINLAFVKRNKIHVVRRLSGGGAVYHDLGNLNFTFIVDRSGYQAFDFQRFTDPIIRTMHKLGVSSAFDSRNDLTIEGRKFSGNAQYIRKDRLLHHGTLLVNSNLDGVERALAVSGDKIKSKGIKSVRSRVTNIREYLGENIPIDQFKDLLLWHLFQEVPHIEEYRLTEEDKKGVRRIMLDRYLRRDWNYKAFSEFNIKRNHRFGKGKVEVRAGVSGGRIKHCKFYGDFFGQRDLSEFERKLIGHRYEKSEIRDVLESLDVDLYFNGISKEGLLSLIVKN